MPSSPARRSSPPRTTSAERAPRGSCSMRATPPWRAADCARSRPPWPRSRACFSPPRRAAAGARRGGPARALLPELERLAADDGLERVRLYTTEVLREARALYRDCGYRPVGVAAIDGRMDLWLEKRL